MDRSRTYFGVLSVAGLVVVLGIIWAFDAFMAFLRQRNAETFSLPYVILWCQALITLVVAALLLLLFWFVLTRAPRNVWIAVLYLLTGLFIVFSPEIYLTPALYWLIPRFMIASVLLFPSYLLFAGAFVAIIGLFILILPRREQMTSQ